jgi:hypothetical protein
MRPIVALLITAALSARLTAQQNPFQMSAGNVKSALIEYTLSGDQVGTEELAISNGRRATHTTATTHVFGKDVKTDRLDIATPDSLYTIDLAKHEGYGVPSQSGVMADEYSKLSAADKQRFQTNTQGIAGIFAQSFGLGALSQSSARGQETVAGQSCDDHSFGSLSFCSLTGAPGIPLRSESEVLCIHTVQEATSAVINGPVPTDRFQPPTGINWKDAAGGGMTEDQARAFVRHMASQQLADSLAQARQQLQALKDSAVAHGGGAQTADSLTPAQHDAMCKTMRQGIHLSITPPNPADAVQGAATAQIASADSTAKALLRGAADSAATKVKQGIFGKLKKPHFP